VDIVEALEALGDTDDMMEEDLNPPEELPILSVAAIAAAAASVATSLSIPSEEEELRTATHLVRGHSVVEVPGKWNRTGDSEPDLIVLPEPRAI